MSLARAVAGLLALGLGVSALTPQEGLLYREPFDHVEVSREGTLVSAVGRFVVEGEGALLLGEPRGWEAGARALRLPGGPQEVTVLEVPPGADGSGTLEFTCQKDGRRQPFGFSVTLLDQDGAESNHDLTALVNGREQSRIVLPIPRGWVQARFAVETVQGRGVWIDDVTLIPPKPMTLVSAVFAPSIRPLVQGESVWVGSLDLTTEGSLAPLAVGGAVLDETWTRLGDEGPQGAPEGAISSWTLAGVEALAESPVRLRSGLNRLDVHVRLGSNEAGGAALDSLWQCRAEIGFSLEIVHFDSARAGEGQPESEAVRVETALVDSPGKRSFRAGLRLMPKEAQVGALSLAAAPAVPGGAHERPDTLLCAASLEGAGVTLLRSQDGGEGWSTVELPEWSRALRHGSLTFDLWEHRFHLIATPTAGGLAHAYSDDLGLTWSGYRVLDSLEGKRVRAAGSTGIVTSTGALVVPVVVTGGFRIIDEDCAGIVVSQDGGANWSLPSAAYPNTSTAAVVELGPGALMLNMTDGRGGARSERLTRDLGVTWMRRRGVPVSDMHLSAGSDGALIHLGRARSGDLDSRLVFANAAHPKRPLREMTIKGSSDNAGHWPAEHRLLLDEGISVNHPSLAPVGEACIGIVYRPSSGGAIFQRLPESEAVPPPVSWFDVTGGR